LRPAFAASSFKILTFQLENERGFARNLQLAQFYGFIGGPDRDRTDDLFHAISKRSRNLLILKASIAPEGPKNALSTSYRSLIAPAQPLLLPRDKAFISSIFRLWNPIRQMVAVIGSTLRMSIRADANWSQADFV
jgi:hypothetical protein